MPNAYQNPNERYAQLYRYYADYYSQQATQAGQPVDPARQQEYAAYYASQQLQSEAAQAGSGPQQGAAGPGDANRQGSWTASGQGQQAQPGQPQQHYGSAPGQQPPTRKKWSVKRKVLTFGLSGLGAVAVIVAAILVIPLFFASSDESAVNLRDYPNAIATSWSYSQSGDYLQASQVAYQGDGAALVYSQFDTQSWSEDHETTSSYVWYEGFADDYEAAYEAGEQYREAYEAWLNDPDFSADYPDQEDYWPDEAGDLYSDYDSGFAAGWYDSQYGGHGDNLVEEPEQPDVEIPAALIDLETGEEIWVADLAKIVPDFDYLTTSVMVSTDGSSSSSQVVFVATNYTVDEEYNSTATSQIVAVSRTDVSKVSVIPIDEGSASWAVVRGSAAYVTVSTGDSESTVIERLNLDDPDAGAAWTSSEPLAARRILDPDGKFLVADETGSLQVLDAATGKPVSWSDELPNGTVWVQRFDDSMVLAGTDESTVAMSTEGETLWKADGSATISSGRVFVADSDDETLSLVDPRTGDPRWEFDGSSVSGTWGFAANGDIIVADGSSLAIIDAGRGEERDGETPSVDVDGLNALWTTPSGFIALEGVEAEGATLAMYRLNESEPVWTSDVLDAGWSAQRAGDRLLAVETGDDGTVTVHGLQ